MTSNEINELTPVPALAYYEIPEPNFATLRAQIAKISRRAKKFGMGEITLNVTAMTPVSGSNYNLLTVELIGMAPIVSGWSFVASITHEHDAGNILRYTPPFTADSVDVKYRTVHASCDHCKLNRMRKDTYVLRHKESGEEKQVGRTCLNEFFDGANPHKIAEYSEMLGNIGVLMEAAKKIPVKTESGPSNHIPFFYPLSRILTLAAAVIRVNGGFVSGSMAYNNTSLTSTAAFVKDIMWSPNMYTTKFIDGPVDKQMAEEAIEWGANLDADKGEDYKWNVRVLCTSEVVTSDQIGLAVSIMGVYLRNKEEKVATVSNYVGTKGERVTFTGKLTMTRQTNFSVLNQFVDEAGNILKWFNKGKPLDVELNTTAVFSGTILNHEEYRGVKSTVLSRVTLGAPAAAKTAAAPVNDKQFDVFELPF